MVDWSKPIEAYNPQSGIVRTVAPATITSGVDVAYAGMVQFEDKPMAWDKNGYPAIGWMGRPWRIRNVTQPSTRPSDEVVARMEALVRYMAASRQDTSLFNQARAIVAKLPEPVDADLVEARDLIADAVLYGQGIVGDPERKLPADFRDGTCDAGDLVSRALAALRRGKQMVGEA